VLRSRFLKGRNRALQALRMAARSVSRSLHSGFGAFYPRMKARGGPQKAMVATAHQVAQTIYHILKERTPFRDLSAEEHEERDRAREIARLQERAAKLGCELVVHPA
jgi:hypothetical protein